MIQSLERGISALFFLSKHKNAGVTEVAEELKVNKSTAFRILETFIAYNIVAQDNVTAKYKLGPGILRLSDQLVKNLNIISTAKPFMARLVEDTGESSHLCMLSNDSAVVIEQIMTNSRLAVNAKLGNSEPIYCSSVGKCLLAYCEEEKRKSIFSMINFVRYTNNTITDLETLQKELNVIQKRGYAVDDGEMSEDIICIAAPVYNHHGSVLYSVGLSGPKNRMIEKGIEAVANKLMHITNKVSEQLGYFKE
jgi:DNA-binding IclR family transcriptional regulator